MTTAAVLPNKLGQLLQDPPMEPSGWTGSHAAALTPCTPAPHHVAPVAGRCHGHPSGCLPFRQAQGPELAEGRLAMSLRSIPRAKTALPSPQLCKKGGPMELADLKHEINSVLRPERDDEGSLCWDMPHSRLSSIHGLDTSYFRDPLDLSGDRVFERLLQDKSDPLHSTLQSLTVPASLFTAALQLFGDSLIEYHEREQRWDVYRFYPAILMTVWSAFEAWVRISSEILVAVAPSLPRAIRDSLLETRAVVEKDGQIRDKPDRRPVLQRYWLLLKYGCNFEYDRGSATWQAGESVRVVRDSLVHYDVPEASSLRASKMWDHMEAILMLFIVPSTKTRRTLFCPQFDLYSTLVGLQPLISEFEERPFHKGWPKRSIVFDCPFDGADDARYPRRHHSHTL